MITLYKTIIRPVLEYGPEIWNDLNKTKKRKLDSIQQKSLTAALGVNKFSKKRDVNFEAKTLPLESRRQLKTINLYKRCKDDKIIDFIDNIKLEKRLIERSRKSYNERLLKITKK